MGPGDSIMTTWHMDYKDAGAVLDALAMPRPADSNDTSERAGKDKWDLGMGWNECLDAYTGGWAEGAKRAYDMAEKLRPRPQSQRTTFKRSVVGAFPNVGAHLAGAPNSMYQPTHKNVAGHPYVDLYVPIGYHSGIEAETAFDRGCAIVALVDALETAGCRLRITLCRTSMMGGDRYRLCMRFLVKDYGDRLDVDQLIFTAAHPTMFRRICFALQERSERATVRAQTNRGYGKPTDIDKDADTIPDGKAITVLLPRLEPHNMEYTPEGYLRRMIKTLPESLQTEIEEG